MSIALYRAGSPQYVGHMTCSQLVASLALSVMAWDAEAVWWSLLQAASSEASEGTNAPCNSASSAQHCSTATSPIAHQSAVPGGPLAALPEFCRTGRVAPTLSCKPGNSGDAAASFVQRFTLACQPCLLHALHPLA